jgi:hypothetical protein
MASAHCEILLPLVAVDVCFVFISALYISVHSKLDSKHVIEGKREGTGDEGEEVSSYWMTLRKLEDTEN